MFGYVVANRPELKVKEYESYRSYYCGLCHALGNTNGQIARLCLNYDSTFAALLLSELYEPKTVKYKKKCAAHGFKNKEYVSNECLDYIADMNLLMAYYKCLDDWDDEKQFGKLCYGAVVRKKIIKITKRYPKKAAYIKKKLAEIAYLEKEKIYNPDKLADCFGDIMAEVLCMKKEGKKNTTNWSGAEPPKVSFEEFYDMSSIWNEDLQHLGFYLGRYIYILDAYDDILEDIEKKRFNPFTQIYKSEGKNFDNYIHDILMMDAAEIARAFERLPIVSDANILRNIIYSGIWIKFAYIYRQRKGENNEGSV